MNKILITLLGLGYALLAAEVPIAKTQMHSFKKSVALNAKVIQLSNAQQSITSLVSGHLEKYFVKPAQDVKKGDRIALIESIEVSKMSADYIALKKQYEAAQKNYEAIKKLYKKGLASMQDLNAEAIKMSEIAANLTALESQLETLNINVKKLTKATANFILYAHSSGRVSALLKPLHSSVSSNEPIVSIVKNQAYYVKSYLPLEYAAKARIGDAIVVEYAGKEIVTHATQIMPKVDETTQRVVVLSSVDQKVDDLFIDVYVKATIYFAEAKSYIAVKKSALSFFNNEWVVFVPSEEEKNEEKEEKGEENEEEASVPYAPQVVEIVAQDDKYVGVKGLELGQEYVSGESYYVKSALLKSSLGDGD
ncbi:efflux RND transporter periplasmic adaptor subunit [Sulfurimonas paralvinellae]|uniref:HlyD family efflux transporter periplasmic adaptor subunit n=1 Tax=Sulfurimonas paralvinellae TaxID=317658 RepID=A0A7M1B570_9BACT|nr:efflux RND transporter periplasmic adaptor subunit [Sulfurimonas paralvinellae]QOP44795.1 HlyD family efflux transporter periplasmic adaptor subunit [Sulfurimonas paralvinellae]